MFDFATPIFFLLFPVPFLVARFLPAAQGGTGSLLVPQTIAEGLAGPSGTGIGVKSAKLVPWALWTLLIIAISGPQLVIPGAALPATGRDVVLALDLSGSMETEDFDLNGTTVSRLDAVKSVATDFVRGRSGDRVALVIFAEDAYFATPLTYDVEAVARRIAEASIGISGRSTAISQGLGLALKRLSASDAASKVVILLSDGKNTSGSVNPLDAAHLARELGVRVHTIAMGIHDTDDDVPIRDAVDAKTLNAVAELSDGTAFRVRTTDDLEQVSAAIDAMETHPENLPGTKITRSLWIYPAALAFLIALGLHMTGRQRA